MEHKRGRMASAAGVLKFPRNAAVPAVTWALVMADVFLSYAHQDIKRAETVAQLLEDAGLTVWWDRRMVAGDKIHDVIEQEIEKAKAVIVLWSPISVKSDWVQGEAQTAHDLTKLVPVKIKECKLPINYRGIHTPEVYKSRDEFIKLAQMLRDKYRTAQPLPGGTEPRTAIKIEFTDKSVTNFLTKLQHPWAFGNEAANVWSFRSIKKDPIGAILFWGVMILLIGGGSITFSYLVPYINSLKLWIYSWFK